MSIVKEGEPLFCESIFICGVCASGFEDEINCKEHVLSHQQTNTQKCDECNETFNTDIDLEWHKETEHETKQVPCFNCDKCDKKFNIKINLEWHKETEHKIIQVQEYYCEDCRKKFHTEIDLEWHIEAELNDLY